MNVVQREEYHRFSEEWKTMYCYLFMN